MIDNLYKDKVKKIIAEAKKKGLIITYREFCKTNISKEYALSKDEIHYYIENGLLKGGALSSNEH